MEPLSMLAAGVATLSTCGIAESYIHRRYLRSIPIRVHVNGTRGKSGVARLIAAGLRAGGIRTFAKTTGTLPRMIYPDGSERPVYRPGRANVIEQLKVVREAARHDAEALVVECMALQPALQSLCELKLIQATHGVITNARADHLDVMGPSVPDVARSLAGTVPVNARLYTAEQKHLNIFADAAVDRNSRLHAIGDDEIEQVGWDELEAFSYVEHPDNVALALRVCLDLGIDRQTALEGMWKAEPDAGVMTVYQDQEDDHSIVFVNGFAANDPESTGKIWELILQRYGQLRRRLAIINCRADRTDRTFQLAEACRNWSPADHYIVVGSATQLFRQRAVALGIESQRVTALENAEQRQILQVVNREAGQRGLVVGMGNISGPGLDLVQYYRGRATRNYQPEPQYAKAA